MIRKLSTALFFLLLACVVTPMDSHFFGGILQPEWAFAQSAFVLEDFALYSQKKIKLDNMGESRGNVGSNGSIDIKKGASGSVIGSFQALGDIKNEAKIGIYGDVTARVIEDKGSLSVSGQKFKSADLVPLTLPALSFSSTGPDLEVPEISAMTIAPGSYGRFKVKKGAAVNLSSGTYYFGKFEIGESAAVNLDVSDGAIHINVVEKIKYKKDADMQIEGGYPEDILINYRGTDKVEVDDHAVLRGILTAPWAKVEFKKGSRLEGAVYADSIHLEKGASFRHYAAYQGGRPPTADAGGYQTILAGGQAELDGSGSSDPDGDAITYNWSFVSYPDGSNPTLSDPTSTVPKFTTDLAGVYVIELSVNDGTYASLRATATITVVSEMLDVTDFVLYADNKIKMDEISGGIGHVGANRHVHIEKGSSGTITGDLRVLDHIKNDGEITIDGDVVTYSQIDNRGTFSVTGMRIENARLTPHELPPLSFSAEGPDFKVHESASQTLSPGSYGRVEVKKGATLQIAAGSYLINDLKTEKAAVLIFDASEGGIELNVVKKLEFGTESVVQITGGSTRDVLINYAGKKEVEIQDRGVFRGTIVAPKAKVEFEKDSRLEGAVYAKKIYLDKGVSFQFHEPTVKKSPPVADIQTVTTAEDTTAAIILSGSDPDGDSLTFNVNSQPTHGTIAGTVPDLIYTPDENYNGTDVFSFTVNDGSVESNPATVNITIVAVNDAPVAGVQTISLNEDESKPVLLTGSDVEGDTLAYEIVGQPTNGTLSGTPPDLTYTPDENYNGADSFSFTVNDGSVDSDPATVNIAVAAVNDAPVANAQTINLNEDESNPVLLTGSDVEGDTLAYEIVGQPINGTLSGTPPDLTYTPDENYNGADSFSFTVNDGPVDSDPATVNIAVAAVNDAPVANAQTINLNEDESNPVLLTGSDVEGDTLAYEIVGQPSNGSLSGIPPDLTYTPGENFNGDDSFSFTVNDGSVDSDPATVNIAVTEVNDAPVAEAGSDQTVSKGDTISLNGSDSGDVDSDTLSYQWSFSSVPAGSTAALSNSSIANP